MRGPNRRGAVMANEAGQRATQKWDPSRYQTNAGFVPKLGRPVLELAAPVAGERVLDLGCGDGVLTEEVVALGCKVTGVDFSADQIAAARDRGLDAHVMDGQKLNFDSEFDLVLSNAAMHWMSDQTAVIDGVWRALKPGGRFASEMGGGDNVGKIRRAVRTALSARGIDGEAHDPWTFPGVEDQRARLESRGFLVESSKLVDRPTPLPGDIEGWLWTFCESFLMAAPEGERAGIIEEVRTALDPILRDENGVWIADYVRLRFLAHKPA